jgi:hypothetical protein
VAVAKGPEFDQGEKLRALITEKNTHYYHY